MKICIPTGTADATGEKSSFQVKNGFFHSGVSFFALGFCGGFPLKIQKTASARTSLALDFTPQAASSASLHPEKTARLQRIQCNRKQHQHRAPARVFAGRAGLNLGRREPAWGDSDARRRTLD